ncbi:MAG: hypothetical protein ACR2QM_00260 [Longimicrobiales bacterium]
MDPEVIFILLLILFSMVEGALRKKKGGKNQLPRGAPPSEGWPAPGELPGRRGPTETKAERAEETSEGMVPADVWKEIEALARGDVEETLQRRRQRGRTKTPRPPAPDKSTVEPPPVPPREVSAWRMPTPPTSAPEKQPQPGRSREPRPREFSRETAGASAIAAAESRSAAGEPRERLALRHRTQKKAPPVPLTEAQQHHGFRGPHALRLAFVAREVLGRPLALREFGEEEFWSS